MNKVSTSLKYDNFTCKKCNSTFINYDTDEINYVGNSLDKAYYLCECLDCKNIFEIKLKDVM